MHIQQQPARPFLSQMEKRVTFIVNQWDLNVKWDGMKHLRVAILRCPMIKTASGTDVECPMNLRFVAVQLAIVSTHYE